MGNLTLTMTKLTDWIVDNKLAFKLPTITCDTQPFKLTKFIPDKKYEYVSDFFKEYLSLINQFNVVILFSKKDMGKSSIGYLWAKDFFKQNIGNMIYGRLQELEKKNARNELFRVYEQMQMHPFFDKRLGKDYICFEGCDFTCRLVNLSSYQSLRGAIGDHVGFMWFDEINAYNFPPNFEADFINIISTLGRGNNFKLFMSGNNETATNNPVLNALQLKFNWNYDGVQLATREINGIKILGIQLGAQAFTNNHPSLAEKLATFNPLIYNTFYLGLSNTNECNKIVNLREDYQIKRPMLYWCVREMIFSFNEGEVNDQENGITSKRCVLVKQEPWNYGDERINKKIPMYTTSGSSDLRFKGARLVNMEDANKIMEPFYYKLKNNQLFFCDFSSNDTFLDDLFPNYHSHQQTKDTNYGKDIKFW